MDCSIHPQAGAQSQGAAQPAGSRDSVPGSTEAPSLHDLAILDILPDPALLIDGLGKIVRVGKGSGAIFGYSPDEVLAFSTIDQFLGLSIGELLSMLPGEQETLRRIVKRNGDDAFITLHIRPVPEDMDEGWLCLLRDGTAAHELDIASACMDPNLPHTARLVRQGQLLESIVHEIQQPMVALLFSARSGRNALRHLPKSVAAADLLQTFDDIFNNVDQSLGMIDRLVRLAGRKPLNLRPVDLNDLLKEVVDLVSVEGKATRVELHADFAHDLPRIRGDAIALQHMFLNLLMNAIEATEEDPQPGVVTVRTRHDKSSVTLLIHDNGPGFPPDHLPHLFEAYFTTKETGSGLGLTIVKSVVDAHQGSIELDECEAPGCTFRVSFPLANQVDGLGDPVPDKARRGAAIERLSCTEDRNIPFRRLQRDRV